MRINLVIYFLFGLFTSVVSSAQVITTFNGQFKVTYINAIDDVQFELKGIFTDNSMNFTAGDVMTGDRIVDGRGYMFEVQNITGINGSEISTVSKALNGNAPTMGFGIIFHPSASGYPMTAAGTSDVVMSSVINTSTLSIDGNSASYSSGSSLPGSLYNLGDVVQLTGNLKLYKLTNVGWSQLPEGDIAISYYSPVANTPAGQRGDVVVSYWDGLFYVYDGSQWTSPVQIAETPGMSKYGDIFYHTTEQKLYMMGAEGEWHCISSSTMAGGPTGDRPVSTTPGDFYFSTDENILYLFDANNRWVEVSVNGSTPGGIINPDPLTEIVNEGDLFYNSSDHRLYVYNGTSWVAADNFLSNGQIYVGNSSNVATPVNMSGDALITNAGKITIQPNAVTNEKLDKLNIPLSGFGNPIDNVSFGDGTTNNRIINLANPIDQQDAVTKSYVMSVLSSPSSFLSLPSGNFFVGNASGKAVATTKGSIPLSGFGAASANVSLGDGTTNYKIVNLANPTTNQDAATKYYVDTRVISPTNLTLPTGMVLVGGTINTATPVAKNTIPFSDFGPATANVFLGNGTINFRIENLANPTADRDAATKLYVDTKIIDSNNLPLAEGTFFIGNASGKAESKLKTAIPLSGFGAATTDVSLGNFKLTNVAAPASDNDAATKKYIDDLLSNPSSSLALPSGNIFTGDVSGKAVATVKNTIPVSAWGMANSNLFMGNATTQYNISFLADPLFAQDAATKNYVDDKVANPGSIGLSNQYLLIGNASGFAEEVAADNFSVTNFGAATADLVMGNGTTNFKVTNLSDPVLAQDAATKAYVDTKTSSGDDLGNHTATQALKMGNFALSNDGDAGDGLTFETSGNATFSQNLTVNGNLYTPSDETLKTNIEILAGVLEKIDQLRGVQFEYKDQTKYASGVKIGVIAQELQKIYPSMVIKGEDGYLKVDYTQLTAVLIQAVKEQQQQIRNQQLEIESLNNRMNNLQKQVDRIISKME